MARNIKLNNEVLKTPLEELIADLYTDTAIQLKFPKPNVKIKKRPKLQFTAETFTQMMYLVKQCSEEIGWLGRVIRDDLTFTIDKLYVFPQLVTGASVTPNETKYVHWNMQLSNDEIKTLRFHGHSHVHMGVFASATDTGMYNSQLAELKKDDFYIFLITNKKGDFIYWIYDLADNIVYEKEDIDFDIIDFDGKSYKEWANTQIKTFVETEKPHYNTHISNYNQSGSDENFYARYGYEDMYDFDNYPINDEDDIEPYVKKVKHTQNYNKRKKYKKRKKGGRNNARPH